MKRVLIALGLSAAIAAPAWAQSVIADRIRLGSAPCLMSSGSGDPEGSVTAATCSTYYRTNGTMYVKASSPTGNTGWVAVQSVITNPVTGTGTSGYLTGWTGTSTVAATGLTYTTSSITGGTWNAGAVTSTGDLTLTPVAATNKRLSMGGGDSLVYFDSEHTSGDLVFRNMRHSVGGWKFTTRPAGAETTQLTIGVSGTATFAGKIIGQAGIETDDGEFKFGDAGTGDTDQVRLFSSGGVLYLQQGAGDSITFRSKTAGVIASMAASGLLTLPGVTQTYSGGWAGAGYMLNYDKTYASQSFLEVDRLNVRGTMSVYELLVHQIRATNGSIFVSNTGKAAAVVDDTGGYYTITTETAHGFAVNDLVRAQRFTYSGGPASVWQTDLVVTAVADTTHFQGAIAAAPGNTTPAAGMEFVRVGNTTDADRQGSIYLTADDTNAPYINVLADVTSFAGWGTTGKTRVRLGNLNGACGYTSNLYGLCAGDSSATTVTMDATNGFRVRYGSTVKTQIDASGNATFTGTVNATAGYFGAGSTKVAINADGLDVGTAGRILGGQTGYNTGTGFFLGYSGAYKFSAGHDDGNRLTWDGTDLTLVSAHVTIDANGITATPTTAASDGRAYRFTSASGSTFGTYAWEDDSRSLYLWNATTTASKTVLTTMLADAGTSHVAQWSLGSSSVAVPYIVGIGDITHYGSVTIYNGSSYGTGSGLDVRGAASATGEISTQGSSGAFTLKPRDGSGNIFTFYNPTGDNLHLYQTADIATINGTTGAYTAVSDARLKRDLGRATSLDVLRQSVVHDIVWKRTGQRDVALFAQEAARLKPMAVVVGTDERGVDGLPVHPWMLSYTSYVPDLIVGWQAHETEIAALKSEIARLKARIR